MRREWAGTSGSARAGRERTDTYIVSITPSTKRRKTDRRGWKRNKKEGGLKLSRHRTAAAAAHAILCWKQTAGLDFPAKKKKELENPCSQRAARSALINNPPTDQQCVRPTHVLISVSGGKKKTKKQKQLLPSHSRRKCWSHTSSLVDCLDQRKRRAAGNSRRFNFVRVLCSCRENKKIIISLGSFVSIRPAENLKEMLFSS